jgi:3-oxoacyl-(acyl-carrier-protein) synthase
MKKVLVTGMGGISAIGTTVPEMLKSLESGQSGIGPIRWLDTRHRNHLPVGEVKLSDQELAEELGLDSAHVHSRTTLLALKACREAWQDAGLDAAVSLRTGLISGTSVGGMNRTEKAGPAFFTNPGAEEVERVRTHDCGDSTEFVAQSLGIRDYVTTISTACSSAANAIMLGARLIRQGMLDRVIVGGVDALTRFTLNGFNALKILDSEPCRPFDESRAGLNLGEAGAFLVLESEEAVAAYPKRVYAQVSGYANTNDAHHQTASSPDGEGAFLAMQQALEISGISKEAIDYLNIHGTGTQNNDWAEGTAMRRVFGEEVPLFSSTKAFTGHTLGAAGGIEAIFSILAITEGMIFPNLNFKTPIEGIGFRPATNLLHGQSIHHVLSNSFGFGGNCTSLIFSRFLENPGN